VDGVQTRVLEEREEKDGRLIEVSRNYFAIDKNTKDVYYFGEDVDMYKKGKVTGHGGAWLAGVKGARFGLMMPGKIVKGDRFYQEHARTSRWTARKSPASTSDWKRPRAFSEQCIQVKETTPLELGCQSEMVCARRGPDQRRRVRARADRQAEHHRHRAEGIANITTGIGSIDGRMARQLRQN